MTAEQAKRALGLRTMWMLRARVATGYLQRATAEPRPWSERPMEGVSRTSVEREAAWQARSSKPERLRRHLAMLMSQWS